MPRGDPNSFNYIDPVESDDEALLLMVYDRELSPARAESAMGMIIKKHSGFLESVCKNKAWHKDEYTIENLLTDVFALVYHKQPEFRSPADATTPQAAERAFRAWLCAICRNLFLKYLSSLPATEKLVPHVDEIDAKLEQDVQVMHSVLECEKDSELLPRERTLVLKFLESLKEDDRCILIESAPFWDPKLGRFDLKKSDAQALSRLLGKRPNTITKQRSRLMDRLKNYLKEHMSNSIE